MKNFLVLVVNLSVMGFTVAAIGTFLNYLFGLNLGMEGSRLPDDPISGIVFIVIAGICFVIARFANRSVASTQTEQD